MDFWGTSTQSHTCIAAQTEALALEGRNKAAMADDERRAAAIREYQKTIVQHKEIETQCKKRARIGRVGERETARESEGNREG